MPTLTASMETHSTSTFSLSLFFILLSLLLLHFHQSQSPARTLISSSLASNSTRNRTSDPRTHYIVRFSAYKKAEEHRSYLESNVRSQGWEWIERKNPAAKFPTDFGLVSIEDSAKQGLVEEIWRLELVKDVNVDMSYKRGLLQEERHGVKKRPGKIFTSMSFSEGEEGQPTISNSSFSWGRQLLMQVFSFLLLLLLLLLLRRWKKRRNLLMKNKSVVFRNLNFLEKVPIQIFREDDRNKLKRF